MCLIKQMVQIQGMNEKFSNIFHFILLWHMIQSHRTWLVFCILFLKLGDGLSSFQRVSHESLFNFIEY